MEALLQLKGIDKAFPGVKALSGAALNVYAGRVMALVGENGAGKSTMMKVLTGIYTRDAGSLLWLGKETTFNGPKSSQEAGIGIIHQELNLIPQLTIAENIFLGREFVNRFGKIDWKQMYAEADKLLAKLNLRFTSQKLVGDLSIGDQQMVEIAKVLSFESKVIIMDEPTDALTDTETESLFRVIRELKSQGRGIVYISHRMKEIFEICDDVTVFRDGQFIAEREVSSLDEDRLIEMMVGRKLEDQYPHLDKAPGAVRLKVDNLCGPGVDNVTFTLRQGEILGVAGLLSAAAVMNAVILTAVLSAGNSGMYASTRMLYTLACDGKAPRIFAKLSRGGVPRNALYATTVIAGLCFLTSMFGNQTVYLWLLNTSGMTGFIAWLGIAISHYRFRRGYVKQGYDVNQLPYRSGFFPLGPIFAFILCLIITLGQNYEAFLADTIDWGAVTATYIGIPLFLVIWFGYKLTKGTHFVRYSEMEFPERFKQ